jgi:NADH:ubiquinone oxidoreductase subunit F (NADH-binding)
VSTDAPTGTPAPRGSRDASETPATSAVSVELPRVLPRQSERVPVGPQSQLARYGPLPRVRAADLIDQVEAAGLTGRGGAAFPMHRKLRAVATGRAPVVVANGAEGEPASSKDVVLLATSPQLVLDGLEVAARAVGARRAYLYIHADARLAAIVRTAIDDRAVERRRSGGPAEVSVTVVSAPARFLAGEESALAARIGGGPAKPRSVPPRVSQRGVDGRPTLVQNVETLAHLALIARFAPEWFRALGTPAEPGSALFTVSGAVTRPGVIEAGLGTPIRELLTTAGRTTAPIQAVLVGGYHGTWLPGAEIDVGLASDAYLGPRGATVGAGVLLALPAGVCGVIETARAVRYLAAESAGQCGPCLNGLPAIADALLELARPGRTPVQQSQVWRWAEMIERRGACHHPDGSVRFIRSALRVFEAEYDLHAHGRCTASSRGGVLPVLPTPAGPEDWS